MADKLPNHLLAHRKRSALSQEEVAFLVGVRGSGRVCKHERFSEEPSLQTVMAYQVIYQKPVSELFPGLYEEIERKVKERSVFLKHKTFEGTPIAIADRRRKALGDIISATTDQEQP